MLSLVLDVNWVLSEYKNQTTFHKTMNEESKNSDNDFEHACDVFEREDYKTAYKLFLSLANKGDADAQVI